jgi:hypothetical protein
MVCCFSGTAPWLFGPASQGSQGIFVFPVRLDFVLRHPVVQFHFSFGLWSEDFSPAQAFWVLGRLRSHTHLSFCSSILFSCAGLDSSAECSPSRASSRSVCSPSVGAVWISGSRSARPPHEDYLHPSSSFVLQDQADFPVCAGLLSFGRDVQLVLIRSVVNSIASLCCWSSHRAGVVVLVCSFVSWKCSQGIRLNVFEVRSYVLIYFGVMVGSLVTLFAPSYASAVS